MEVFKICRDKYSNSLTASGASNRWNKKDEFVIYTGSSRSLSTLELIVHRSSIKIVNPYKLLVISIKDKTLIKEIKVEDLPKNWRTIEAYIDLQEIGSQWYNSAETLVLKIPSVIIPQEFNYMINTKHPLFKKNIVLNSKEDFNWDERLL